MARPIDRRTFLGQSAKTAAGLVVAGSAGSLLAACGSNGGHGSSKGSGTSGTTGPANRGGASTATPKSGGSLIFGVEADEAGFDPTNAHFDSVGVCYARTVYDPLAIPLADGRVVPYLAQSITNSPDYTEWTVTLRPNLFFHDGTPCNAAALAFCFNAFKASTLVNFTLGYMKEAQVVNGSQTAVKVIMHKPWVTFPAWLCGYIGGQIAYPFSPTQWKKAGSAPGETLLNSHPVGTGPFIFQTWVPNDHFTATKNPNYWRKDKHGTALPYLEQITFKPLPVASERWTGLQTGTLDMIHTDDPRTVLDIQSDHSLGYNSDVNSPVEHDMDFGMINTTQAPLNDVRIRQAIAHSFNATEYLSTVGLNIQKGSTGPFSSGSKYYAPTGFPTYDLPKAQSLVSSYKADHGGAPVVIEYGTVNTPSSISSAALIRSFAEAAGMTMNVTQVEQSALITNAILGAFHMYAWRQFANIDPDLNYPFWASAPPAGGISVNFTRLQDPTVQQNIDRGRQTADEASRIQAYQAVAKQFGTACPYIWAAEDVWALGAGPTVQNFNNPTTPEGQPALEAISGIIWPTEIWKS
jgi:peptide/nickel transport system substrate-binding protein